MSTLSELQKKLQQESQGIMFPFSAATPAVNTTQQVYDSSTDGIMTMTGKKYIGPNAVIQYGTEAQGYPRQLKQIEAPMLPQVSNLPPAGTGIIENAPGTTVPDPITETPVEQPAVNPCPPGYQLVNGVCQQVAQQKPDEPREKFIPTYDIGPGSNQQSLKFYSSLYENGGVDSNSYYGLKDLIVKDGSSLSFNFSNLDAIKKESMLGFMENLLTVHGPSVIMKGQMKFLLENNLATGDIDMKLLDPITFYKRPENTTLNLNEKGQSFIENIDNVNKALYSKNEFGNIKGKSLFRFLGNEYGSGGIGLKPKEMQGLMVELAANFGSLSSQFLLNTKNSTFDKGGSLYHLNKLGFAKQYDITKFREDVQKQYTAESIKEFDESKKERDSKRKEQRNQSDDMKNEFNKIVEQAKNENDPKEKIRLLNKASVYSGAGDRAEPTYNKKGEKEKDLPSSYGDKYQGSSSGGGSSSSGSGSSSSGGGSVSSSKSQGSPTQRNKAK